ncbi:MAG: AraC family transcriptional regulator [Cognaticolwellia sp.]
MSKSLGVICSAGLIFLSTLLMSSPSVAANESSKSSELANELESIKQQVLTLNRELFILEEDLLFPASTQVAIFVSVDIGKFFTLDSVELKIDDQDVAGFLYTERQRKALEQGGIQGLYQGNLKKGQHQLTAIFTGFDNEKRPVKRAASYSFVKEDDAVMLELKIEDQSQDYRAHVVVEEWLL